MFIMKSISIKTGRIFTGKFAALAIKLGLALPDEEADFSEETNVDAGNVSNELLAEEDKPKKGRPKKTKE